jgi:hypothetical protein
MNLSIAFLLIAAPSLAAPPPDADLSSPFHTWFEHQHSVTGDWCCSLADGHYEVWINRAWHTVPATALRDPHGGPNPTGRAIVWWSQVGDEIVIRCFAPGSEF